MKLSLLGLETEDLHALLPEGEPAFRARQLYEALYHHRVASFEEMTALAKPLRLDLAQRSSFGYPEVATAKYHIDILTAHFVQHPDRFDVVVASNLFGDILSDLGPALAGSIGLAPSANINPERTFPSMFEPVHGSAPDIAGKGIANPIGQIWAAAMMLDHLGQDAAAREIEWAIETVVGSPDAPRTPDLGGAAGTQEVGRAIVQALTAPARH